METIVKLCFELLGTEIPPKEISRITGIVPSLALMRGETNRARDIPSQNIWALDSQKKSDAVTDLWQELEAALQRSRDVIKEIATTGAAKFTIVIESDHRLPSVTIPPAMGEFAGFVNAVIDIDHMQR